jgi:hypothetical protein
MMRRMFAAQAQGLAPKSRSRLPWALLLPWLVPAVILAATAVAIFWPRPVESTPAAPGQAGLLVWGDGVFANPLELDAWLRIRGVTYAEWARRHPAGVKIITSPPGTRTAPAAPAG